MPNRTIATVAFAVCVGMAAPAVAQLNASQPPIPVAVFGGDVAYDPVHDAYLTVGNGANSATVGVFADATTRTASAPFVIHAQVNQSLGVTAVYSPDVSDGAGGRGGFVVMWSDQDALGQTGPLRLQIVAFPGRLVGPVRTIVNSALQIWALSGAYSPADHLFLFTWTDWQNAVTQSVRLDLNAQPIGVVTPLSPPNGLGCNFEQPYDCADVKTVWNPVSREFGALYRDGHNITVARVGSDGIVRQRTVVATGNFRCAMDVNTASGSYIVSWARANVFPDETFTGLAEVGALGGVLRTESIPGVVSNLFGIAISYSPVSRTLLFVGRNFSPGSRVVELDYYGTLMAAPVQTAVVVNQSLPPRIAARANSSEWAVGQVPAGIGTVGLLIVTTGSLSCGTGDPFAALGGGLCFDGGWYPPSAAAPTPTPTPSPSPTPGGCLTADPFTAFGGGTCVNGGWFPPSAGPPPPTPSPTPTPTPTPPVPGGCTTPDPFVAFGGGVCFNGGWYFKGGH